MSPAILREDEPVPRAAMRTVQTQAARAWCTQCDAGKSPRWEPLDEAMHVKIAAVRAHARATRHKVITQVRTHRTYQPTKGEIR